MQKTRPYQADPTVPILGDTPSSCRLFDAIASHCVPVVVSDQLELPFEDVLDYTRFAIFVPADRAVQPGYLAGMLRNVTQAEWETLWQRLKEVGRSDTCRFLTECMGGNPPAETAHGPAFIPFRGFLWFIRRCFGEARLLRLTLVC